MENLNSVLTDALRAALDGDQPEIVENLGPDTDLYELVDSFVVVNILLESESLLETKYGRYVTLADETIFDAEKSPLRKWSSWVSFVKAKHEQS